MLFFELFVNFPFHNELIEINYCFVSFFIFLKHAIVSKGKKIRISGGKSNFISKRKKKRGCPYLHTFFFIIKENFNGNFNNILTGAE